MEDTVKERLTVFLKFKGISKSEFGRRIGVSSAFVSSMRKSIQPDKIKSIALNFPDLNTVWLLTGEGEMLKNPAENLDNSTKDSTFIPNSYSGLTDEQIEKEMEDVIMRKLLKMYEDGLIYSAASVKEYQQRIAELMNENAKLGVEVDRLHQQLEKQQESRQLKEEASKPTR